MNKSGLVAVAAAALLGACGAAQPGGATNGKLSNTTGGGSAMVAMSGGPASCDSVAKLIIAEHGVKEIAKDRQDRAKRGGAAMIAATCVDDEWPQAALDCMATRPSPISCTGQLSEEQQGSYEQHLAEWDQKWTRPDVAMGGQGYGGAGYGGNPCGGGGMAGNPCGGGPMPPQEEYVGCEMASYESWAPEIGAKAHDHDFAVALRKRDLSNMCEMRWANPDKKCFNAAKDAASIAACRGKLDDGAKNAIDNVFAEEDAHLKELASLEKNTKSIDCKTVANAHYSDDAWHNKLMSLSASERKRVITESRDKLAKACTDDKWEAASRACVVASKEPKDQDMQGCFPDEKTIGMMMYKWGFPAGGVTFKTGILECDKLAEVVDKLASCDALPKETRDMVKDSIGPQLATWMDGGMGMRHDDIAKTCKQIIDSYTEAGKQQGCKM